MDLRAVLEIELLNVETKGERDSEKCGYCTRENLGKSGENLKIFRNVSHTLFPHETSVP